MRSFTHREPRCRNGLYPGVKDGNMHALVSPAEDVFRIVCEAGEGGLTMALPYLPVQSLKDGVLISGAFLAEISRTEKHDEELGLAVLAKIVIEHKVAA